MFAPMLVPDLTICEAMANPAGFLGRGKDNFMIETANFRDRSLISNTLFGTELSIVNFQLSLTQDSRGAFWLVWGVLIF